MATYTNTTCALPTLTTIDKIDVKYGMDTLMRLVDWRVQTKAQRKYAKAMKKWARKEGTTDARLLALRAVRNYHDWADMVDNLSASIGS